LGPKKLEALCHGPGCSCFGPVLIVMEGKEEAKSIQNLDLSPLHKGPSQGGCYESKGFRPSNF